MANPGVEKTAKTLVTMFEVAGQEMAQFAFQVQRLLLEQGLVSPEQIADILEIPLSFVTAALSQPGAEEVVEMDSQGNVLGLGITLVPKPHRYQVKDRTFYVLCATEALVFPLIHGHTAQVESPDPVSNELVRLTVTQKGARNITPNTAVVSSMGNVPGKDCVYGRFFSSRETASHWLSMHPGGVVLSIDEVYQIWQIASGEEPLKSILEG